MPHSFPDGEVSGVFRSPWASIQMTPSRSWREASPSTAPMCEQQQPPRTSGRCGQVGGDRERLRVQRVLLDDRRLGIVERQARRLDHRLAAVAPGPRDAHEPCGERPAARVALVVRPDRDGGVGAARRALGAEQAHASAFSKTTFSCSTCMPTRSYRCVAPVGFSASTPSVTRGMPRSKNARNECRSSAFAYPLPAPGAADADRADVAAAVAIALVARDRGDLVAVSDHEPDREVEVRVAAVSSPPLLERGGVMLPVILERLVERRVERPKVLLAHRLDGDVDRRRRLRLLDRHLEEVAHVAIAVRRHQCGSSRVGAERELLHARGAVRACCRLRPLEQLDAEPGALPAGMDDADADAEVVGEVGPADGTQLAVLLEEPAVVREIGRGTSIRAGRSARSASGRWSVCSSSSRRNAVDRSRNPPRRTGGRSCERVQCLAEARRASGARRRAAARGPRRSRLIQIVGRPSSIAGATSWKRLAPTCTRARGSAPVCSSNASQCRWPGLYEPISDATITWSNGTPISSSDDSM